MISVKERMLPVMMMGAIVVCMVYVGFYITTEVQEMKNGGSLLMRKMSDMETEMRNLNKQLERAQGGSGTSFTELKQKIDDNRASVMDKLGTMSCPDYSAKFDQLKDTSPLMKQVEDAFGRNLAPVTKGIQDLAKQVGTQLTVQTAAPAPTAAPTTAPAPTAAASTSVVPGGPIHPTVPKQVYATLLFSEETRWTRLGQNVSYLECALVMMYGLRQHKQNQNETRQFIIAITPHISQASRERLIRHGATLFDVPAVRQTSGEKRWEYCPSKFALNNLTQYDEMMFIDADHLVVGAMDTGFAECKEPLKLCSVIERKGWFNAGFYVFKPDTQHYNDLIDQWNTKRYGTEQDLLNAYYKNFAEMNPGYNRNYFGSGDFNGVKSIHTKLWMDSYSHKNTFDAFDEDFAAVLKLDEAKTQLPNYF